MTSPVARTTSGTSAGTAPLDLLIVGAGIGGIDMAHHVAQDFPDWTWRIVDSNTDLGGTWNTFAYPGIRSDSDMATFALPWKPWRGKHTLGRGEDIREYLRDAAREDGTLDRLQLNTWVKEVNFDTTSGLWEVTTVPAHDHGPDDRPDAPAAARGDCRPCTAHPPVLRLLRPPRGLPAALPRPGGLHRRRWHPRPRPGVDAGGAGRRHREEDRRHRVRCHGGDTAARPGRPRCPGHDAAAHTDVDRRPAGRGHHHRGLDTADPVERPVGAHRRPRQPHRP